MLVGTYQHRIVRDAGTWRFAFLRIAIRYSAKVEVSELSGISLQSIRTTTENAYVSGLGATKRVVLYDTLVARRTPREVDLVVAHEIGLVQGLRITHSTRPAPRGTANTFRLSSD